MWNTWEHPAVAVAPRRRHSFQVLRVSVLRCRCRAGKSNLSWTEKGEKEQLLISLLSPPQPRTVGKGWFQTIQDQLQNPYYLRHFCPPLTKGMFSVCLLGLHNIYCGLGWHVCPDSFYFKGQIMAHLLFQGFRREPFNSSQKILSLPVANSTATPGRNNGKSLKNC